MLVVGAGFAGLYMVHSARGLGLTVEAIDVADGVGGTWYWNRYPGARCDVPSLEYSFGFDDSLQQEWEWSERYATQPEILSYLQHVAERFDLYPHLTFGTRVERCVFDDRTQRWSVHASDGVDRVARFVVMGTGCLSSANMPKIPGQEDFTGRSFHTGRWPHEGVDFAGRRVAVIGTGSSAIQSIPVIAEQAEHVTVFQRTANYAVPAHNQPLDPAEVAAVKADYIGWRKAARDSRSAFGGNVPRDDISALAVDDEMRLAAFDNRWKDHGGLYFLGVFNDLMLNEAANDTAAEYVRGRIRAKVNDPETAALLSPETIIGCKRLCVDTGYYETYNRPNVSLVDISGGGVDRIDQTGVVVGGDGVHEVDDIVYATGFDAMTGALDRIQIEGRDGLTLKEAWSEGPRTYLGLQSVGFPNLFTITGPGSPSVLTNMVASIEQHVELICELFEHMAAAEVDLVEPVPAAQDEWVDFVNAVADMTLFGGCNSWYLGANIPGKPRVFMPLLGFDTYQDKCREIVAANWEGFAFSATAPDSR